MDFLGTKLNGKRHHELVVLENMRRFWGKIKEGQSFTLSLKVLRMDKTNQQVKAVWGMVIGMTLVYLEDQGYDTSYIYNLAQPTGNAITKDQLMQYLYEVCPITDDDGSRKTLSKADMPQTAKFFDDCRNFIASQWGLHIPEPNPEWKIK